MSGSAKFSYVETFLQKTIPSLNDSKLIATKTMLRNKPIMLVAEKKAKKSKQKPRKRQRMTKRILAKPTNSTYSSYERLRTLWKEYISNLLDEYMALKAGGQHNMDLKCVQDILLKADYHGADITVADTPCRTMKGISGTVLQVRGGVDNCSKRTSYFQILLATGTYLIKLLGS